ncbi:phospholipid scramblase 2-like [Galleria mellonella]|uniref:Phospholipid scramblase n=1 Tax=Galleria mellonella TaxID=7137 RepID=A0ABM3MCH3_GALME|nr:phospholipid scramblase 2-like [Galleria mellonella]XP_052748786.1 phospholipid scramblase 2-like [Galleria mellonella]XP_052748787.1 phospholipid scramblase 2-like [Galleria mellonella]
MAESQLPPLGIRHLIALNHILVRQKTRLIKNKYKVLAPDGSELLYAKEDSSVLNAMLGGSQRSFHIDIFDMENKEVITLRRPFTFGPDKMDVSVCGTLACVVRQKSTFLKPVLTINDAVDRPVLKIKGPIGRTGICDFDILTLDKRQIGVIRKKWNGMLQELLTDIDSYEIHFPLDLDVRYKAAVIGACFLIDFLFYEI